MLSWGGWELYAAWTSGAVRIYIARASPNMSHLLLKRIRQECPFGILMKASEDLWRPLRTYGSSLSILLECQCWEKDLEFSLQQISRRAYNSRKEDIMTSTSVYDLLHFASYEAFPSADIHVWLPSQRYPSHHYVLHLHTQGSLYTLTNIVHFLTASFWCVFEFLLVLGQ